MVKKSILILALLIMSNNIEAKNNGKMVCKVKSTYSNKMLYYGIRSKAICNKIKRRA